jgi:LuxR family transcriptional regulator, maltose regulon positive regulatory protein
MITFAAKSFRKKLRRAMTATGVVPPVHAVDRPALRRRLDQALSQPLALIVAPAGAGKSVLVAQWAASRPDLHYVWLHVDPRDDDPVHFSKRLLKGLSAIRPDFADLRPLVALHGGGLGTPMLEELGAQMADLPDVVIVIDDLHQISNATLLADLGRLAEVLPGNVHLVLSTRVDLPLAWSRYRMRLTMTEIRQADLVFDVAESTELLERIVGRTMSADSVTALVNRTEGWAAGLHLAAMTLRQYDDTDADEFVIEFSGSDRLVADYLTEEVLQGQSDSRRVFLLRVSVLDELTADLVAHLTGEQHAQLLLEELERESMFLIPLDTHRTRFRFHHLFRDLMRYRLRVEDPSAEAPLLRQAADWHLERGEVSRAVQFLLRAREWERVLEIVLSRGSDVFERGQMATVIRWIEGVPESIRAGRQNVNLLLSFLKGADGQAAAGEDLARKVMTDQTATDGERLCATVLLTLLAHWRPRPETTVELAVRSLDLLDCLEDTEQLRIPAVMGLTDAHSLRTIALVSGGRAHFLIGNMEEARDWLERGLRSVGTGYSIWKVSCLGSLALLEAWCGRAHRAEALAGEALAVARGVDTLAHPSTADAYLALTFVALHRSQPNKAALYLHEATVRSAANQLLQLMWICRFARALLQAAEGLTDEATTTIVSATPELDSQPPPIVSDRLFALRSRLLRLSGSPVQAIRVAGESGSRSHFVTFELALDALALRELEQARKAFDALPALSDATVPLVRIEHHLLAALLSEADDRIVDARAHLGEAMAVGDRHWLVEAFVNVGPPMVRLLSGIPGQHEEFRAAVLERSAVLFSSSLIGTLADPLTDRELEILSYLPSRLTNIELANKCYVSVNTIKTHMAHIFQKLGAANRNDAIDQARQMGLL